MRNEELGISTAALLGQRHFSRGVERGRGLYSDPGEAVLYPIWPPMTRATTSSARVHRGRSTDPGHDAIRRKPNFLFHQHLPQIQSQKWRCPTKTGRQGDKEKRIIRQVFLSPCLPFMGRGSDVD